MFGEVSEETIESEEKKISRFEEYFMGIKVDLVRHKDQMKRLAELKSKLNAQRYHIMSRTLPEYEGLCLNWFNNVNQENLKKKQKKQKKEEKIVD